MTDKDDNVRAGFYSKAQVVNDFDAEAAKHSVKLSEDTGAKVKLSRGDFIEVLTKKLKAGEIVL